MRLTSFPGWFLVAALIGCGGDDGGGARDGGADMDADGRADAAGGDASREDAAERADASSGEDAGPAPDGAVAGDGGVREDAPSPSDAGAPDALRECDLSPCFRAYECAADCGSDPFYVGCCPCPEGSVDLPIDCARDAGGGRAEGETCGGELGECAAGLSCCYPCGIPGCENRCEPTCTEGMPGCFGGCFLRP